jgi:VWFA-related protein
MSRPIPSLLASLATAVLLAAPVGAQEPPPAGEAPLDTFLDTVRVHVVNLEVFVTDRAGKAIGGLAEEDFELIVDGRAVPITNFEAVSVAPGGAVPPPRAGVAGTEPPTAGARPPAAPPHQDLHLVFYIDNFNLRPVDRNLALRALQRFVTLNVPAGARMMLVTYDHGLNVRQPFTTDGRAIVDAADEAAKLAGQAIGNDADRRQAIDEIEDANDELYAVQAAVSYAEARKVELQRPLRALRDLMEPLGGLPGRKAVIYVSNGLPHRIGEDLFFLVEERFPRSQARMRSFLYETVDEQVRLTTAANSSGVTLYSLDATGLGSFESLSAAEGGSVEGGSFVVADTVRRANLQIPLKRMADDTGGTALTNSNNLDLFFDRLAQDVQTYYSLGYHAAPGSEGRYLPVEVRVKRKGAQVRTRRGFRVRSAEQRLEHGVMAALTLGRADDDFPARIVFGASVPKENGLYGVPLSIEIPLDRVTLVPGEREWVGRLRLAVQARDGRGDLSALNSGQSIDLRIPAADIENARRQHVTWSVELLMERGRHHLAVGLADLFSDQFEIGIGTVEVPTS